MVDRRNFIACSALGLSAGTFSTASTYARMSADSSSGAFGSARRCVLVWLDGGPSHLETFDPKPQAGSEIRGPLRTISTRIPGVAFAESVPQLAERNDAFTLIRSMTSPVGEHNLATNYALSGHIPGGRAAAPAFQLPIAEKATAPRSWPAHIAVPDFRLGGGSRLQGFMSDAAMPWSIGSASRSGQLAMSGADLRDLQLRRSLLDESTLAGRELAKTIDLLTSREAQQAMNLERESAATRARYGSKPIGKHCLIARRLLESGVPLVTVNNPGWDTHENLADRIHHGYTGAKVPVGLAPSMDKAVAALLDDLNASGLIEDTLVIVMGEFGRTPKINARGGRDHWPRAYSVLLAGAATRRGLTFGASDSVGENAADSPVTPADLVATLYHLLGLDPHVRLETPDGQSLSRVPENARVVHDVLA